MSGKGEKKRRRALDAYGRLQRAADLASARVEASVHPFGLSASQFGVLDTLHERGAVHQQELAHALGRSKAQMTAIIDALEKRGLVRRERHATDRRYMTIHLTDAGVTLHTNAVPVRTAAVMGLMSELSGKQRGRLASLCRRLLRTLDPAETEREGELVDDDLDDADDETDEDVDGETDDDTHGHAHSDMRGDAQMSAPVSSDIVVVTATHGDQ